MQIIVPLAFSLGMFLPLDLNIPLLAGGLIAWFISNRSKDAAINKTRKEKGTLLASGLMAGGAIMGVVSAIMKYAGFEFAIPGWDGSPIFKILTIVMYIGLCTYLILHSRVKKENVA